MLTRLARLSAGPLAAILLISFVNAPSAQASKARLKALSQSDSGSLFLKDSRDIFLNPAMVNELENNANFEWGSSTGDYATELATKPNPEGGGLLRTSALNYAVEVGRLGANTQTMIAAKALTYGGTDLFYPQNGLDFVLGGSANALKWGAGLHYARSQDNTGGTVNFPRKNARDLSISGGVLAGNISGYGRLDLIAESATDGATSSQTFGGKLGGELGGKFDIDSVQSVGVSLSQTTYHFDRRNGTAGDLQGRHARADYFRLLPAKEGTTFFVTAGLEYTTVNIGYSVVGTHPLDVSRLTTPVVLGLEHKALSWLDLRASVSQSILLEQNKLTTGTTDLDQANLEDTKVAAGFTLHTGDIQIDATFSGVSMGTLAAAPLGADVAFLYHF